MRMCCKRLSAISTAVLLSAILGAGVEAAQNEQPQVELVVATDVSDREPVGGAESFRADVGELVAWTRVTGAAGTTIDHVWRYQEDETAIPLDIEGSPWRTWSRKSIPAQWVGEWTVEVRDAGGNVLASAQFTIGDGAP
jgi:hypothetical protein